MLMPDAGNIFDCPMDVAVTVSSTIAGTSLSGGSGSFTVPRLFNLFWHRNPLQQIKKNY